MNKQPPLRPTQSAPYLLQTSPPTSHPSQQTLRSSYPLPPLPPHPLPPRLLLVNYPRYSNLPRSVALTSFSRTLEPSYSPALNSVMHFYSRLITRASPYFTCDQFILLYYTSYSFTPSYPSPRSAFPLGFSNSSRRSRTSKVGVSEEILGLSSPPEAIRAHPMPPERTQGWEHWN